MRASRPERLGPRPLALHLGHARAGPVPSDAADTPLLEAFLCGLHAYWRHPNRRRMAEPPVVWQRGAARLLDYGPRDSFPALIVPSLINRAYILDLMPERSLVRYLSRCGIRPLLLDWGEPGPAELRLTLAGYVERHLCDALEHVRAAHAPRPALIGYCMGGVLALALASLRAEAIAGIGLLATPWDFHRGGPAPAAFDGLVARPAAALAGSLGGLPVDLIQTMFAGLEPQAVARKFARFAGLDPASPEAGTFVAIEDWLNDGVPLAAEVARECLIDWYVENRPARGLWQIGGRAVRPEALDMPALVAIPARDRIVPPASAGALADALPRAEVRRAAGGHIGMVVGRRAERDLWRPLAAWLHSLAAMQENP
jgi:polyhydroxyalkanoate synthase